MKYCSKCGKEIHDEAVICVHCGCAVESAKERKTESVAVNKGLAEFVSEAKTIHILGIVSIVLCLGIGIVFQIINILKIKKYSQKGNKNLVFPEFDLKSTNEVVMYEDAVKKIKTAQMLTVIGYVISVIMIAIAVMSCAMAAQL